MYMSIHSEIRIHIHVMYHVHILIHSECRNADKKFSPALLVFHKFATLSPASAFRHSDIMVNPVPASHGLVR